MISFFKKILGYPFTNTTKLSKEDIEFHDQISLILGEDPTDLNLYKLAMLHKSKSFINTNGHKESNERLEFLGDSILGMIVAEFLYKKFYCHDEGFLTILKSKLVNTEMLDYLCRKIGLDKIIISTSEHSKSMRANAFEAFLAAIYLDKGFQFCEQYLIQEILLEYCDLKKLIASNDNYKSLIIEWAQKKNKKIEFLIDEVESKKSKQFESQLKIDERIFPPAVGHNKREAEQSAAKIAFELLKQENENN